MIKENFVALSHFAQIISRCVIADACPRGLAVSNKIRPRVSAGFLFYQPEIFHASNRSTGFQPVELPGVSHGIWPIGRRWDRALRRSMSIQVPKAHYF
jgi:hypothetical protein